MRKKFTRARAVESISHGQKEIRQSSVSSQNKEMGVKEEARMTLRF